jgi:two-component system alkaline phosphatase synthesis response regulator PhoP
MLATMPRILVVDDEPHITEIVGAYLARDGHQVLTAADGDAAMSLAERETPDLVVLDVMLPGRSGFDVLRELRRAGIEVPVLMLTARDDVIDRVAGLEIGADDYVTKPFEPRELVARVSAILRRTRGTSPAPGHDAAASAPEPVRWFDLEVDTAAREVRRGPETLPLTRAEFDLLVAFVERAGIALTREQLGERVFGEAFDAFDRTMDSHVKNLRHKLGPRPDGEAYIETIRGVGYRGARP